MVVPHMFGVGCATRAADPSADVFHPCRRPLRSSCAFSGGGRRGWVSRSPQSRLMSRSLPERRSRCSQRDGAAPRTTSVAEAETPGRRRLPVHRDFTGDPERCLDRRVERADWIDVRWLYLWDGRDQHAGGLPSRTSEAERHERPRGGCPGAALRLTEGLLDFSARATGPLLRGASLAARVGPHDGATGARPFRGGALSRVLGKRAPGAQVHERHRAGRSFFG